MNWLKDFIVWSIDLPLPSSTDNESRVKTILTFGFSRSSLLNKFISISYFSESSSIFRWQGVSMKAWSCSLFMHPLYTLWYGVYSFDLLAIWGYYYSFTLIFIFLPRVSSCVNYAPLSHPIRKLFPLPLGPFTNTTFSFSPKLSRLQFDS